MRAGPLLLTTRIEEHRPLGLAGEAVYLNHRKIAAVVAGRLGEEAASYLARPEIDQSGRRINWHAVVDGPVRRWIDLSPAEQAALVPRFAELQKDLGSLAASLERSAEPGRAPEGFSRALRLALRSPGIDSLFVVGDRPVLALWGFEGGTADFDTLTFRPGPPAGTQGVPPIAPAVAIAASRPWWHWLLWWLLPLLALLLIALFLLRSCFDVPIPVVDLLLPGKPAPIVEGERGQVPDAPPVGTVVVPPGTASGGSGQVVVPDGTTTGPATVTGPDATTREATVPGQEGQPPAAGTGLDTPPVPPAASDQPDKNQPPPGQPPAPKPEEQPKPPEDETNPPGDQSKPPADQPKPPEDQSKPPPKPTGAADQAPPPPKPANPLTLPAPGSSGDPKGLAFLKGQWRSDSGLVDKATGKPLRQLYRFDEKGQGTVVLQRADGVECRGQAQARRVADGGLRIEETGPVTCPDGRTYAPAVTECTRDRSGGATCRGLNRGGSSYQVQISR